LHILSQIGTTEDDVLIIDEPTPHLHPLKIKYLGRKLSELELSKRRRQLIIITHSPFFVDTTLFSKGRNLVYIRKDKTGSSKMLSKPQDFVLDLKLYLFKSEIFFSHYNIFVEGPGDASCLKAISEGLDNVLEKNNVLVVDLGGKGTVDNIPASLYCNA
jgi:predicted ATP-dependent endonuclease of OLD family